MGIGNSGNIKNQSILQNWLFWWIWFKMGDFFYLTPYQLVDFPGFPHFFKKIIHAIFLQQNLSHQQTSKNLQEVCFFDIYDPKLAFFCLFCFLFLCIFLRIHAPAPLFLWNSATLLHPSKTNDSLWSLQIVTSEMARLMLPKANVFWNPLPCP